MEIIIVDNASTDRTIEIVVNYLNRYLRNIFHICLSQKDGQANVRNIGIERACSKYITFVDAVDRVSLDRYEKLLKSTELFPYDMVHCFHREDI